MTSLQEWQFRMINKSNIINLNSYIRMSSIQQEFEESCLYVTSDDQLREVPKYKNVIFETSQLKNRFFDHLNLQAIDYTVINCLSSTEIFEDSLYNANGLVVFDNVCCCRNNEILEKVIGYKNKKMLVC